MSASPFRHDHNVYDSVVVGPFGGATENRRITHVRACERAVLDQVAQRLGGLLKGEGPVVGGRDLGRARDGQARRWGSVPGIPGRRENLSDLSVSLMLAS